MVNKDIFLPKIEDMPSHYRGDGLDPWLVRITQKKVNPSDPTIPFDLTGCSARMQFRDVYGNVKWEFTTDFISNPGTSPLEFDLNEGAILSPLIPRWWIPKGIFSFDLQLTLLNTKVETIWRGNIEVVGDTTQPLNS